MLVLHQGRVAGILAGDELTPHNVLRLAVQAGTGRATAQVESAAAGLEVRAEHHEVLSGLKTNYAFANTNSEFIQNQPWISRRNRAQS